MPSSLTEIESYQRYLAGVPDGTLSLPTIHKDDRDVIIHVDELFCRVQYCRRPRKAFPGTNDLRYHVKHAHGIDVRAAQTGRPSNDAIENAIKFYEAVIAGVPEPKETEEDDDDDAPMLPLTRADNPSQKKMRELLDNMGIEACPCSACARSGKKASGCCRDRLGCDHFDYFNCSEYDTKKGI